MTVIMSMTLNYERGPIIKISPDEQDIESSHRLQDDTFFIKAISHYRAHVLVFLSWVGDIFKHINYNN